VEEVLAEEEEDPKEVELPETAEEVDMADAEALARALPTDSKPTEKRAMKEQKRARTESDGLLRSGRSDRGGREGVLEGVKSAVTKKKTLAAEEDDDYERYEPFYSLSVSARVTSPRWFPSSLVNVAGFRLVLVSPKGSLPATKS